MPKTTKVKIVGSYNPRPYLQCPGKGNRWEEFEFIADPSAREYDWLVVLHELPPKGSERHSQRIEHLACPGANTMLVTFEPSCVKVYGKDFVNQYACVLSPHEERFLSHPNTLRRAVGNPWFYMRSYDEHAEMECPKKTKSLSVVVSSKSMTYTLHAARLEFVHRLKLALPQIDWFGHGVQSFEDKSDVLLPYKYHLVIENQESPDYWSEKLADSYLGYCLPIYFGCTNLADYFPQGSWIDIDMRQPEKSIEKIAQILREDPYDKHLEAIKEARQLVLNKYNLYASIAEAIKEFSKVKSRKQPNPTENIYSRRAMWRHNWHTLPAYLAEKIAARRHFTKNKFVLPPPQPTSKAEG